MNIDTNTLLGMLNPQLANVMKQKVEDASVDGKVNLGNVAQDKTIQSLLNSLFKNLATGAQTKQEVLTQLQNKEHSISFKNLSQDIKSMITTIEKNPSLQGALSKQLSALQSSLLDLGKIDSTSLKSSLNNTGIFLESKLLGSQVPINSALSSSIQNLSNLIDSLLTKGGANQLQLSNIEKQINTIVTQQEISQNTQSSSTKNLALNILQSIQTLQNSLQTPPQNIQMAQKMIDSLEQTFAKLNLDTQQHSNIKSELINQLKSLFSASIETKNIPNIVNSVQINLAQVQANPTVPSDIKVEIKSAVEQLLRQANLPSFQTQLQSQQTLSHNLHLSLTRLESQLTHQGLQTHTTGAIKEVLQNATNEITFRSQLQNLNTVLTKLYSAVEQMFDPSTTKTTIKEQIQNAMAENKSLPFAKTTTEQLTVANTLLQNLNSLNVKLDGMVSQVQQQNIVPKDLTNDLKGIILQIQDSIQNSDDVATKELRTLVDRLSTQIEYFQLLSYTSNSSHTYLSFLQDGIEDADITFHKSKDDTFSCQINLFLKNQGEVKILLLLDKEVNLNVNMGVENKVFQQLIQENLQQLRFGLNKAGLLLQNLYIFNLDEQKSQEQKVHSFQGDDYLSFGLDVKA
jgi:hypothetical protein